MKVLRMSRDDFLQAAAAVSKRGFAKDTLEMAECVLVGGETVAEVVARYGKKHQQLTAAVAKIRTAYKGVTANSTSQAFVRAELELPGELAVELSALSEEIRRYQDMSKVSAVLRRLIVDVRSATKQLQLEASS